MGEYVDVEISLPNRLWKLLERLAKMNGITLNQLANDIIADELDKLDAKNNSG